MNYSQYRVKIGSTIVKNTMMAPESYQAKEIPVIAGTWTDNNHKTHREVVRTKMEISFSLRERFADEQASIATIFSAYENLTVQYWDDKTAAYKTIDCFMTTPTFSTKRHGATLIYLPTQITLTEY